MGIIGCVERRRLIMDILKQFEGLIEEENVIAQLQKESLPLVMWGAGSLAVDVMNYLQNNDIYLSDIFVDEEYYSEGMSLNGCQVLSYSMLCEKYSQVNVILGCSNYEKIQALEKEPVVHKVFYLFSIIYNLVEKTKSDFISRHITDINKIYEMWEDDFSKEVFLAYFKTRISGNYKYVLDVYKQECNYFNNDVFKINRREVYLDVGAYNGDTIRLFLSENGGGYKWIYAMEPDDFNRGALKQYITGACLKNITVSEKGAWNKKDVLNFCSNLAPTSSIEDSNREKDNVVHIDVDRLDNVFDYKEKVTMLKVNYYEGVYETILGGGRKNFDGT